MNTAKKLMLGLLRGSGAAAEFSPLDIAGLVLWLDASDSTTLFQDDAGTTPATADGAVVGRWVDKSGAGNHVTQAGATAKPLLKLAVQNGLPSVRFDGANDYLQVTFGLAQPEHVLIVFKHITYSTGDKITDGATTENRMLIQQFGSAYQTRLYAGALAGTAVDTGQGPVIAAALFSGTSSELRINGGAPQSNSLSTTAGAGFTLGGSSTGGAAANIDAHEVLIYSVALTDAQRQSVEEYYAAKWAV